jgi:hypothetical protein
MGGVNLWWNISFRLAKSTAIILSHLVGQIEVNEHSSELGARCKWKVGGRKDIEGVNKWTDLKKRAGVPTTKTRMPFKPVYLPSSCWRWTDGTSVSFLKVSDNLASLIT